MTLTMPSATAPSAVTATKDGPPIWMTLEGALEIISDHYEWDPKSTTLPKFAILNKEPKEEPIKTVKPLVWGVYKIEGKRVDEKIKLTITRSVETTKVIKIKSGRMDDEEQKITELKELPLLTPDFTLLKKERFILVDHRTGTSTESREFLEKSQGSAEIMFDLKNDFVVPRDKAHPRTEERLTRVPWVNNCYTLVQVKE